MTMKPTRGRDKFSKYKSIIVFLIKVYGLFPRKIRLIRMDVIRGRSSTIALTERYILLKTLAKSVGDNVAVYQNVYLRNIQNLEVGSNVSFQPMVYIDAYGGVTLGNNISFAEGSSVISMNHRFNELDIPIKDQGLDALPVSIQDNVWIGAKATILGNTTIAPGTIVGAGAVVTKSTVENAIVGGVPAKVIRIRGMEKA